MMSAFSNYRETKEASDDEEEGKGGEGKGEGEGEGEEEGEGEGEQIEKVIEKEVEGEGSNEGSKDKEESNSESKGKGKAVEENGEGESSDSTGENVTGENDESSKKPANESKPVKKHIGNMNVKEIREELRRMSINAKGNREEIETRLRKARKALKSGKHRSRPAKDQPFDYYLIFDVEATCVQDRTFNFPNEIIEFPVVLLNGKTLEIDDEFHSYVKPVANPILSDFCTTLTGIQQSTVDASPIFPEVLRQFNAWVSKHQLFSEKSAVFLTDGPWDIRDFITKQLNHSSLRRPHYFEKWINLRRIFQDYYGLKEKVKLSMMLEFQGMEFEGREHSGISDSRNIARIAKRLIEDGCILKVNDGMNWRGH